MNSSQLKVLKPYLVLILLTSLAVERIVQASEWHVRSKTLALRSGPSAGTSTVTEVPQGSSLKEVGKKGLWVELETGAGKRGWALWTLLSRTPVAVTPETLEAEADSQVKRARARPRIRSATMGVRGLRSSQLTRGQDNSGSAASGVEGVQKMEQSQPSEMEVKAVQSKLIGSGKEN